MPDTALVLPRGQRRVRISSNDLAPKNEHESRHEKVNLSFRQRVTDQSVIAASAEAPA
jgi:hypothetical protein